MMTPKTVKDYREQAAMDVDEDYVLAVELLDITCPSWRVDIPADQYEAAIERMQGTGIFARAKCGRAVFELVEVAFLKPLARLINFIRT